MAIRVEFYAKDQVTASSILEFALSCGAVLQAYSEVEAPLEKEERGPRGPYKKTKEKRKYTKPTNKRARMDYKATLVKVANSENYSAAGSIRWQIMDVILGHKKPTLLSDLQAAVVKKIPKQHDATVRSILRDLIATEHLVITS